MQLNLIQRWMGLHESWRFAIIAFLVLRAAYGLWSWTFLTLQPLAVQNITYPREPVLTIFNLRTSDAYTYDREVGSEILTFRAASDVAVTDVETSTIWSADTGYGFTGAYAGTQLHPSSIPPSDIFPYHRASPHASPWLALWQRFDANWYVSLAENGYGSIPGDDHFPPLFPVLVRLLAPVFGGAFTAGLILSHLAALILIKLLYDFFTELAGKTDGRRALLFYLIYPTFFFMFSVYSESVFLVFTLLALRGMQGKTWHWAGFWAFCSILTRLQGAALLVPMIYLMWRDPPVLRRSAQWIGLALPGLAGLFYLFLRSRQVADEVVPVVEAAWHARIVAPWETYGYTLANLFSGNATFIDFLNWAVATLFIVFLIAGWRRIPLEHNLYMAVSLFIILIRIVESQPLISMSRYSLTLFPAFLTLSAAGDNPWVRRLIVYTLLILSLYLSAQFFSWGWVA